MENILFQLSINHTVKALVMPDFSTRSVRELDIRNYLICINKIPLTNYLLNSRINNGINSKMKRINKERVKSVFGKYLSPSVARSILASEEGTDLGGRQVEVAVLFNDIRDYTKLAEGLTPSNLIPYLNEYFTMLVRAVYSAHGVLDKFIGDAAMAVFGLDDNTNACDMAVSAACAIQDGLEEFNIWAVEKGYPRLQSGTGIHYGPVVAGNIGSSERLEYTVIGDTVNIASRLESLTKKLSSSIAISQIVYENLSTQYKEQFPNMGEYLLKGKQKKISVYGFNIKLSHE